MHCSSLVPGCEAVQGQGASDAVVVVVGMLAGCTGSASQWRGRRLIGQEVPTGIARAPQAQSAWHMQPSSPPTTTNYPPPPAMSLPRSNYDPRRVCLNPFPALSLGKYRRTVGIYLAGGLVRRMCSSEWSHTGTLTHLPCLRRPPLRLLDPRICVRGVRWE